MTSPGRQEDTREARRNRLRLVGPVAALTIVSIGAILLLLWHTAGAQNRLAMDGAAHIAETVLRAEQKTIGLFVRDYAWWEEAAAHPAQPSPDPDWAAVNIGPYVDSALNLPRSYVVAPDDRAVYAHAAQRQSVGTDAAETLGDLGELAGMVAAARRQPSGRPEAVSGVLPFGGVPHLVAAAPLLREVGEAGYAGGYVLVFARPLDAARLAAWSAAYRLPELAFHAGPGPAGSDVARLALATPDGTSLGTLSWQPELPGAVLLLGTLPSLLATLAVIGLLVALFLHSANRSARALERAERFAGMGRMAAGMAHELAQPLHVIRMAAENIEIMVEEDPAPDRTLLRERSRTIADQAARMGELIHHMRISARQAPGRGRPFDARASLQAAIHQMRPELEAAGARIEIILPADPVPLRGSALQFEQVVVNLLANARDAISARQAAPRDGHCIALEAGCREGRLVVQVSDTGDGIESGAAERLFEPFFTTKPVGKGMGLGLWVSQGIITRMGGRIRARNTAQGAAIDFYPPLSEDALS